MTAPGSPYNPSTTPSGGPGAPGSGYPPAPTGAGAPAGQGARRGGVGWTTYAITIVIALLAIAVAVFIVQNTDRTEIEFFGTERRFTKAGALGLALGAGFLIGLLVGLLPQIRLRRELRALRRSR